MTAVTMGILCRQRGRAMSDNTYFWTCPQCAQQYRIPEHKPAPAVCPACRRKNTAESVQTAPVPLERSVIAITTAAQTPEVPIPATRQKRATFTRWHWIVAGLAGVGCIGIVAFMGIYLSLLRPQRQPTTAGDPVPPADVLTIEEFYNRDPQTTPNTNEVFERAVEFLKSQVRTDKIVVVEPTGEVSGRTSDEAMELNWWVHGKLNSPPEIPENVPWTISMSWNRNENRFEFELVKVQETYIYRSQQLIEAENKFIRVAGNEFTDLPDDVARDIRNVNAAVIDAIKTSLDTPFLPQWPTDPERREFRIGYRFEPGHWEATGKIETFDGEPRQDIVAYVRPQSFEVIRLKVGRRWVMGGKPPGE